MRGGGEIAHRDGRVVFRSSFESRIALSPPASAGPRRRK